MNSKAEMTTQQIVLLIILIASFAVILFLLFRLDLGSTTDDELCRNSVVLSSKSSFATTLDCKISRLCITFSESCAGSFQSFSLKKINVQKDSQEIIQSAIFSELASQMSRCNWLFGEGALNYLPFYSQGSYCAICNEIVFSPELQKKISTLTYQDFYMYLSQENYSKSQKYLQYLYQENDVDQAFYSEQFKRAFSGEQNVIQSTELIDLKKRYFIVTGLNANIVGSDRATPVILIPADEKNRLSCDSFDLTKL